MCKYTRHIKYILLNKLIKIIRLSNRINKNRILRFKAFFILYIILFYRSCGRGLVTKPNLDSSKTSVQQEREKITNNVVSIAQNEMKIDNPPESQLDKENNVSKTVNTFESLTLTAATCNTTGYDSDSSKPVKVKSRWRRSSELEMGGSNTGTVSTSTVVFGNVTANTSESGSCSAIKSTSGALTDINTSDSISGLTSITNIQSNTDVEQTKEVTTSVNNNNIVQIPKTVGARIPLPMVPEIEDREMEERLSQFEYLRENLYLTERCVSKMMFAKFLAIISTIINNNLLDTQIKKQREWCVIAF